ncbi:3-ketosteroid-delta-1-dehydrogenase [Mycolicibacterium duvalii]|uniref:3-oxosteroid 1-dehydrogenase n=1 Tax=Mycolicibacterium duvalii TaxID=39688 RepID=A0A7I7JUM1_9MYCO|nr:FAD-binding protein [Mycolicibacterium duvalii]MCV7370990.1 FAD-binding protein [Mycolicibacterium duvalii]PEG37556.1 3-ketosteroid-delta-1-dehydrogenase [Mycolicibacterium duvalii]BBX15567.1 3-ketosteroid-delta-1-dehydrogenase [Mycolicibacterium duvalii]
MNSPGTQPFDHVTDVLVIGSGGGGMTAALAARTSGLQALVVEKADRFGGSTALSGGGIWVPGAPSQRREGYEPNPDDVFGYLKAITGGLVSDARLRTYVEAAPKMMEFLEKLSPWLEFVWKPGYADYYPELPGGSALGSTINVPEIDLRVLGAEEQNLLAPLAMAPRGIWFAPKDLRLFYQVRQNWRGKAVLLKLIWRMVRARVFGDRMAAIGQSLAARLRLALQEQDIPLWLDAPMTELITDTDGPDARVIGAVVERDGKAQRIQARHGVILASGGFDHDMEWRREHLPELERVRDLAGEGDWSFGNPAATGDGIRAGEKVGGSTELLDEAWWFPAICWPDGRLQFMLNERMMPSQFVVNGEGKRFINEAAPYMDFAHAMIDGERTGVTHIPCWLITDIRSFHRYVVAGHLPLPKIPFAPVPTGWKVPQAWLESGVVHEGHTWEELAGKIGVPPAQLRTTAERFNELARRGHDDDFNRGHSAYDNYYGDPTLPNPNLHPLRRPPYYAFQIILGDLGTSGGLRTDEHARVLRSDDSPVPGLYAVGNASAAVMGRSYAGAGATIGPAMTFGYVAAKHIAASAAGHRPPSAIDSPETSRR